MIYFNFNKMILIVGKTDDEFEKPATCIDPELWY